MNKKNNLSETFKKYQPLLELEYCPPGDLVGDSWGPVIFITAISHNNLSSMRNLDRLTNECTENRIPLFVDVSKTSGNGKFKIDKQLVNALAHREFSFICSGIPLDFREPGMDYLMVSVLRRGTKVRVTKAIDDVMERRFIRKKGLIEIPGIAVNIESMIRVRFPDGERDAFWPEELEVAPPGSRKTHPAIFNHSSKGGKQ